MTARTLKDRAAIVGVGATPYYRRARSLPQTTSDLAVKAILAALDDAGLTVDDVDGFALYGGSFIDVSLIAQILGIPEVRFTAGLTGGGGGAAGSIGLAAAAVASGMADVVVSVLTLQQANMRFGASFAPKSSGSAGAYSAPSTPESVFASNAGLMAPGQMFAMLVQRHMHLYGTTRDHLAEVAISTRNNAIRRDTSLMRDPLTREQYFDARMISDPFCLYDYCMECDGAVAAITTTPERARDLRQAPVYVMGSGQGGAGVGGRRSPGWACPTSTSRRRGTVPSRSACTRWRESAPPTSTSRCCTTTSPGWCSCNSRTTASAASVRAAGSWPTATSAGPTAGCR